MKRRLSMFILCCLEESMEPVFYIAGAVAAISTALMLTRLNVVHALLYLIVSFLAIAVVFFVLGAPFVAALEVIVYAGAIMVLFVFAGMMFNLGQDSVETEREWLKPGIWIGPVLLAGVLFAEVVYLLKGGTANAGAVAVGPKEVGMVLFGPYLIGVELASMLLLAGVVGSYHLGFLTTVKPEIQHDTDTDERRADTSGDLVFAGADQPARTP
jgi:NADH-quinone oxidoreductase subunit J